MIENRGDLISREALLKAVEEERQYLLARGLLGAEHILVHHCLPLIDNAPTVEPERPQGEWIPVRERLPEKGNQSYLVTVDYGEGIICSCQRFFFNDEIGWNDDCVIAWQPLPEPYTGGMKNEINS